MDMYTNAKSQSVFSLFCLCSQAQLRQLRWRELAILPDSRQVATYIALMPPHLLGEEINGWKETEMKDKNILLSDLLLIGQFL